MNVNEKCRHELDNFKGFGAAINKLVLLAGSSKLCDSPVGSLSAGLWNNFSFGVFGNFVSCGKHKKSKTLASHIISAFLSGLSASVK